MCCCWNGCFSFGPFFFFFSCHFQPLSLFFTLPSQRCPWPPSRKTQRTFYFPYVLSFRFVFIIALNSQGNTFMAHSDFWLQKTKKSVYMEALLGPSINSALDFSLLAKNHSLLGWTLYSSFKTASEFYRHSELLSEVPWSHISFKLTAGEIWFGLLGSNVYCIFLLIIFFFYIKHQMSSGILNYHVLVQGLNFFKKCYVFYKACVSKWKEMETGSKSYQKELERGV